MKKASLLLLALLPFTANANKTRLIELEDKMSIGYLQTTNAKLVNYSYTSNNHFVHVGGMHYDSSEFDYKYSSGSLGYSYVEDDWTAGVFYVLQSNDTQYLSSNATKTINLSENLHVTTGVRLAGLWGEGFSNVTITNSTYVLYNITDEWNISGFYKVGGVDVIEGMGYSESVEFSYGAIFNYSSEKLNITYSLSNDRDYGQDGVSNLLLASYPVLDNLRLQGYYYNSTNEYVDSTLGLGIRFDF